MFNMQLGTLRQMEVAAVEERYAKSGDQLPVSVLVIETGPVQEGLNTYVDMFSRGAALSPLTVSCEGVQLAQYEGYSELADLSIRLTSAGRWLTVTLKQPNAE